MADFNDKQHSPTSSRPETGDLAAQISRVRQNRASGQAAQAMRQNEMTGAGRGLKLASELVAAVAVGGFMGFGIDALLGTRPWFFVVMFLVGVAAGILNVVRAAMELNANAPRPDPNELVPVGDDYDDED